MENKKNYIKPELKSVEFKVELGFAASLSQGTGQSFDFSTYDRSRDTEGLRVNWHGFLSGNNEDWD